MKRDPIWGKELRLMCLVPVLKQGELLPALHVDTSREIPIVLSRISAVPDPWLNRRHPHNFYRRTVYVATIFMTEDGKRILIALAALAILILPSSASGGCTCSCEDFDWDAFSSVPDAQACYHSCNAPVAYDSNLTIARNTLAEITLQATDPHGDEMTYRIGAGPSNGTLLTISGDTVVYCPKQNYTGEDRFSFTAHDGSWESVPATVTITIGPDDAPLYTHSFHGNVTVDGNPAPENAGILVVGPGVRSDTFGNPALTQPDGSYGSADDASRNLIVQGCIENGTPLAFYVDGARAEVCDANSTCTWQSAFPFRAGEVTCLDLRVSPPDPLPDEVYINALRMTISNSTFKFSTDLKLEGDPWMEARVTPGMFTVRISATGVHRFSFLPEFRRDATLGIYENGRPVSMEKNVWFGWDVVSYEYVPKQTRTFEVRIAVDEQPEIFDVRHITISTAPPERAGSLRQIEGIQGLFLEPPQETVLGNG